MRRRDFASACRFPRLGAACIAALVGAALGACGGGATRTAPADTRLGEERPLVAASGGTLWVPLDAGTTRAPRVRLGDRSVENVELVRLQRTARDGGWLGPVGMDEVAGANDPADRQGILIRVPTDLPTGARLVRIGGTARPAQFLEGPRRFTMLADDAPGDTDALAAVVAALATNVDEAWRLHLLEDRLGLPRTSADGAVERIAGAEAERVRLALGRLDVLDATLARDVADRCTALLRLPSGELLPAWAPDEAFAALVDDLLDGRLSDAVKRRRARLWLDTIAPVHAWVVDDAGAGLALLDATDRDPGGTRVRGATVAVANCSTTPRRVEYDGGTIDLGPGETQLVTMDLRSVGVAATGQAVLVSDGTRITATVVAAPVPAVRPGLRIGPLLEPWTLAAWRDGAPRPATAAPAVALLDRRDDGGWRVLVECRMPAGADASEESCTLLLGPYGAPSSAQTLRPGDVGTRIDGDRWTARFDVPAFTIEGGYLRIGLLRTTLGGRMTSWPRPLLPGDTDPGRLRIDLEAWAPVSAGTSRN